MPYIGWMTNLSDDSLNPPAPGYLTVLRVRWLRAMALLFAGAVGADLFVIREIGGPVGLLSVAVLLFGIWIVWRTPARQFACLGHQIDDESMRVVRGYLFRTDTIVPLVRIQHIDVGQGPLERFSGVAHLVVHTAGTHNSVVMVPGLEPDAAHAMRDLIRRQIRTDFA